MEALGFSIATTLKDEELTIRLERQLRIFRRIGDNVALDSGKGLQLCGVGYG